MLELLKAVLVMLLPSTPVAFTVMVRTSLAPLAKLETDGQITVRVKVLYTPPLGALTKFKFAGS